MRSPVLRHVVAKAGCAMVIGIPYVLTALGHAGITFRVDQPAVDQAYRDCAAVADCTALVGLQVSALSTAGALVRATTWLVVVAEFAVLVAGVIALLSPTVPTGRLLVRVWKLWSGVLVVLLLGYAGILAAGEAVLARTPVPTRLTASTAFDTPFLDVGTAYYVGWFVLANVTSVVLTWYLARALAGRSSA